MKSFLANGWFRRAQAALLGALLGAASATNALAQPANDLCENAQVVTTPGQIVGTSLFATGIDLTPFGDNCGIGDTADVWYLVPGGATPRQFSVLLTSPDPFMAQNMVAAAFTACPTVNGEFLIACPNGLGFLAPAGQSVYIRVSADDGLNGDFVLDLNWMNVTGNPVGDLCSAPIPITAGSQAVGNTTGYTGNDVSFGCGGAVATIDSVDVWYQLVVGPGDTGNYIITTAGSGFDTTLAIFTACLSVNGEHELACDDDVRSFQDPFGNPIDLTSSIGILLGEGSYLLRVAGWVNSVGPYVLNVSQPMTPIPGDACQNALPTAADTPTSGSTVGFTGFNVVPPGGFAANGNYIACVINDRTDAWHVVTPSRSGVYTIHLDGGVSGGMQFPAVKVFNECGGNLLVCEYSNGPFTAALFEAVAGEDYYIRVAGFNSLVGAYMLTLISPPINDDCVNALPIVGAGVSGTTDFSNSADLDDYLNYGLFNGVWYTYTPPFTGWYTFSTVGSNFDTSVLIFDACGGDPLNLLAYNNDIAVRAMPPNFRSRPEALLTGGQTYLVEVAGHLGDSGNFVLNVAAAATPTVPANDVCASAQPISHGFAASIDARRGTADVPLPSDCSINGHLDLRSYGVWFTFTAVGNGAAIFTQTGTSQTGIHVYSSPTASCGDLAPVACGDSVASWYALNGATYFVLLHTFGYEQSVTPYTVGFTFVGNTGSCCTGTTCAVSTRLACESPGGSYLGDASTCAAPSGENATVTPIVDPPIGMQQATTTVAIPVAGAPAVLTSLDILLDISSLVANDQTFTITSPSGTVATLVNTGCVYFAFSGGYRFSDSAPLNIRQGMIATAAPPDYLLDSGAYKPYHCTTGVVSLNAAFAGQNPNGIWTLSVTDHSPFPNNGILRSVRLFINGGAGDPCAPPPCRADFNGVGGVTVQDIFDFLGAYFANLPSADFNGVGGVTVQDIFDFLSAYFTGCP